MGLEPTLYGLSNRCLYLLRYVDMEHAEVSSDGYRSLPCNNVFAVPMVGLAPTLNGF
jgi:hypothetical protein